MKVAAGLMFGVAVWLWSGSALACPACSAGDPTIASMGEEQPQRGGTRLGVSLRGWGHRASHQGAHSHSDDHAHDHGGASQPVDALDHDQAGAAANLLELRLDVSASYAITDRLVLAATLPLQARELTGATSPTRVFGVGDADVGARFVAWQHATTSGSTHVLSALAGVEVPSAPLQRDAGGSARSLDLQTGSGSIDPRAGVAYSLWTFPWSVHASAVATLPTRGFGTFRAGPSLKGSVAGQLQPLANLGLRLGVDARVQQDDVQYGSALEGTGGAVGYLTPAVLFTPTRALALQLQAFVPVLSAGGPAAELPTVSAGVLYDF